MDLSALIAPLALVVAIVGIPIAFWIGKRQERASGRVGRAQLYPPIVAAMNDYVNAVERVAPGANPGMDEERRKAVEMTYLAHHEFRDVLQAHASVIPADVALKLVAVDDAWRLLIRPTPEERIALAGLHVLTDARDAALRAIRADAQPDAK